MIFKSKIESGILLSNDNDAKLQIQQVIQEFDFLQKKKKSFDDFVYVELESKMKCYLSEKLLYCMKWAGRTGCAQFKTVMNDLLGMVADYAQQQLKERLEIYNQEIKDLNKNRNNNNNNNNNNGVEKISKPTISDFYYSIFDFQTHAKDLVKFCNNNFEKYRKCAAILSEKPEEVKQNIGMQFIDDDINIINNKNEKENENESVLDELLKKGISREDAMGIIKKFSNTLLPKGSKEDKESIMDMALGHKPKNENLALLQGNKYTAIAMLNYITSK